MDRLGQWFENEYLDCEIGIDVVVAHEADDLAAGQLLDLAADVDFHDALPAAPEVKHRAAFAGIRQRPLTDGQAVLKDDEDAVFADGRLCLCRAAAGRAGECLNDGVRDCGRKLAVGPLLAHRVAGTARGAGASAGATGGAACLSVSGSEQRGQSPTVDAFAAL